MKTCSSCRMEKDESEFYRDRTRKDGLYPQCRRCASEAKAASRRRTGDEAGRRARRAWRKAHPDRVAASDRRVMLKRYGLTPESYDAMWAAQQERCAICSRRRHARRFAVDHDHETGRVRGILCDNCNQGIGKFADSPDLLRAAARYLEDSRCI